MDVSIGHNNVFGDESGLRDDLIEGMEGLNVADNIDNNNFHDKYEDDEVIAEASAMGSTKDNLKHFSKDMRSEHYKIRDPEVQRQWGEKKTEMQKRASKALLLTDYALRELYRECTRLAKQKGEGRLFTVITRAEDGRVNLSYAKEHLVLMRQTLGLYLDGESQLTRKQLIDVLVDEYHLSYHHFVKKHATNIINRAANIKKKMRTWDKCDYDVMQHPVMVKSLNRLERMKVRGDKKLIDSARDDVKSDFVSLNNELECVLEEKGEVMAILTDSVGRPDFILRLLKALVNNFVHYRNRLIETNLRLVLSIAHKNKGKASASNIGVTDLISEGAEGLLKASEMYVSGIGVKFTTYAEPWINLKITRHIKNSNDVRIPIHCTDLMYRICKHFNNIDIKDGEVMPSKLDVETQLKERITDEIWEMALNRFNGISISMSCDHSGAFDDDTVSFDHILGDKSEEQNGSLEQKVFSDSILAIAKGVLSDNEYKVLTHYYLKDENYVEIHHHLDRHYSSKSISMIKTRAIAKIQAKIQEMGGLASVRPL